MNTNENFEISVPFPPKITIQDLIPAAGNHNLKVPNAFIAYRIELVRELKSQNIFFDRTKISTLASKLWAKEPEEVKKYYKLMSSEARLQYNQGRGLTFISNSDNTIPTIPTQDDFALITSPLQQGTASES